MLVGTLRAAALWVVVGGVGWAQAGDVPKAAPPGVEAIVSMRSATSAKGVPEVRAAHKKSYDLAVKDSGWLDTGVDVAAGEPVLFGATGSETLGDGRTVNAAGLDRGWKDLLRQFPLNSAKTGSLIGRVSDMGASVPFAIGTGATVVMPTSGRLYLRANLSDDLSATGTFDVHVTFPTVAKVVPKADAVTTSTAGEKPVAELVTPQTFAKIPRRVSDEAGDPGDMVNYGLVGTEEQVKAAFAAAGWVAVDKSVGDALVHGLMATLSHEAYTEMPMSTLYLFGRPQDLSFARGDPLTVAAERHHLRVWKTDQMVGGKPLWVGSATHDIGFEKDQRNGKATHKIDPQIDGERTFLLNSFDAAGVFTSAAYVTPEDPLLTAKTATGGSFYSDGRIVVMDLK